MISRQCFNCIHLVESGSDKPICLAFPEGIPEEIITGEVDHSKPYAGDNGFMYEPIDKRYE